MLISSVSHGLSTLCVEGMVLIQLLPRLPLGGTRNRSIDAVRRVFWFSLGLVSPMRWDATFSQAATESQILKSARHHARSSSHTRLSRTLLKLELLRCCLMLRTTRSPLLTSPSTSIPSRTTHHNTPGDESSPVPSKCHEDTIQGSVTVTILWYFPWKWYEY